MGLAGFGKGFASGYEKGEQMKAKRAERKMRQEQVKSRGADGATGAGAANEPAKKVKNLQHSKQKGMSKTKGGW